MRHQNVVKLALLLGLSLVAFACGSDEGIALHSAGSTTVTETTVAGDPIVIACESGARDFSVEVAPTDAVVTVSAEEANALLDAPAAKEAPTSMALVYVTIPSTFSNAEPDSARQYVPGGPGDPGRSERRLAWQITKGAPEGTLYPFYSPPDMNVVPDPETCVVKEWVTFVDATSKWPLGTFPITK